MTVSNIDKAKEYAKAGIRVFPCDPVKKSPQIKNGGGYYGATVDLDKIDQWWSKYPNALIGGVSDDTFTVIDVDCGGVCPDEQKKIILGVVDELKEKHVIDENTPCIQTKSGGYHYYLKHSDDITRKINYLPAVDILSTGGYSILPDESTYKTIKNNLVDNINNLKALDKDTLEQLHEKYNETRIEVKEAIDIAKGKKPKKRSLNKKSKPSSAKGITSLNNTMMFERSGEKATVYSTSGIFANGNLSVRPYTLDRDYFNDLFFNQDVQISLAEYLGLNVPPMSKHAKGTLQRSILVGHADYNPSMGLRWTKDQSHVIARDFSDHYGDGLYDYNVVRLFMNKMYKTNVSKPSKTEWTIWFLRMLYEAGLLDVSETMADIDLKAIFGENQNKKIKAAESILLLDALKRLHKNYSGEFPVSKKFMKGWCPDVHPHTSYLALKELVAAGVMEHTGTEKLSEKRSLYLYTVVRDEEPETTENSTEAVNDDIEIDKETGEIMSEYDNEEPVYTSALQRWLYEADWDERVDMAEIDREDAMAAFDDVDWDEEPDVEDSG